MGARWSSITSKATKIALAAGAVLLFAVPAVGTGAPAASAASAQGGSCDDSWINTAGGQWTTGANWSTGLPPSSTQAACITVPLTGSVVIGGAGTSVSVAGLTLGSSSGADELVLQSSTLILGSSSTVERTGEITTQSGSSLDVQNGGVLTNDGMIVAAAGGDGLTLYGNYTNEPDGLVSVSGQAGLDMSTGTLTNLGELTVGANSSLLVPYEANVGAVLDNAGGTIQNQGTITINGGGTFEEGAGSVVGAFPLISNGTLDLAGKGSAGFTMTGGVLKGTIAPHETVVLNGGTVAAGGSVTNDGMLTLDRSGGTTFNIAQGQSLSNGGSLVVPAATGLTVAGNLVNLATGTITVAGSNSIGGSGLSLSGGVTFTNHGNVVIGAQGSSLNAGNTGTIDNAGGIITNGGAVQVGNGGRFIEGAGATTGNPVQVSGALDITGAGPSSFQLGGSLSGDVASGQTIELGVGIGNPIATGSFTNAGTLVGDGSLAIPSGDTLTNDGTIEVGRNWNGLTIYGNVTNAPSGVIGEDGDNLQLGGTGTTFDNAGTLEFLYASTLNLDGCSSRPCDNTFTNAGTILEGTNSAGAQWGSGQYDSDILAGTGDTLTLGGTIAPVPDGVPSGGSGSQIGYGINSSPGTPPAWALSCPGTASGGWTLSCSNSSGANLTEPQSTTLTPTALTLTGSGTSESYGWQASYGQPITFTATVSASGGGTPTGTVSFYAAQQDTGNPAAIAADLIGTGTLSTSGGVTSATFTTSSLPPGKYDLLALYGGDSNDLAAANTFGGTDDTELVNAVTTPVALGSSPTTATAGTPVVLTASVTPAGYGPANPSGVVTFFEGNTVLGSAPVVTKAGATTATITTTELPVGSDSLTASYSGDYSYAGGASSAYTQAITASTAPTTATVSGPANVAAGATYKATTATDGTGTNLFALASSPAAPAGMTINSATGDISYAVPASGVSSFSYAVVVSNAGGQAESAVQNITVGSAAAPVAPARSAAGHALRRHVAVRRHALRRDVAVRRRDVAVRHPARTAGASRRTRRVTSAVLTAAVSPTCDDSWTNNAGGNWATGANWSTGAPPTPAENACITVPLTAPVVLTGTATAESLTLGGASDTDDLEIDGATLTLESSSSIAPTGELSAAGSGGNLDLEAPAVLTNDGVINTSGTGIRLYGDLTNAADGLLLLTSGSLLGVETGTLLNAGEVSVQSNATLDAPYGGNTGAVIDNAAGALQNQGAVNVNFGGTFEEGAGTTTGVPPLISRGGLEMAGKGASRFEVAAYATLSGTLVAGQTVLIGGPAETAGAVTNGGTLATLGGTQTFTVPNGSSFTNTGTVLVPGGAGLDWAGKITNSKTGTIAVANGGLTLEGGVSLVNDGSVSVGSSGGTISAGSAGTIDNVAGTIANGGTVNVPSGASFVEAAGTTTGGSIIVSGQLDLTGTGSSSFTLLGAVLGSTMISGNVSAGQTVWFQGTPTAAGSFTNNGTLVFDGGQLDMPGGTTLTNDGTIEFGHGGGGSGGMGLNGNLVNAASGVMGETGAGITLFGVGNTFDNAGTFDFLFGSAMSLGGNTFVNSGTVYWGVGSSGASWGGFGLAANINPGSGGGVELGGTIFPVPNGEPSGGSGTDITYGIASSASCPASVTSGWYVTCVKGNAVLDEPASSTLTPTQLTITGSGTSESYGWESSYGQPVTFTATVSASGGGTPTGTVAFYAAQQNSGGSTPIAADLIGTSSLSTTGGVASATITTSSLPPGNYMMLGLYSGDSSDLAASNTYGGSDDIEVVSPGTTSVALASSPPASVAGSPVALTATVTPGGYGPAAPSGVVTFLDGNTVLGAAPVVTKAGITTATISTSALPIGSDSLTASYSGDDNYAVGTSPADSQTVSGASAPTTVTVSGPSSVKAGATYKASTTTNGTGTNLFALESSPAAPVGMTINSATGAVSYVVPASGVSSFSYVVAVSNSAGQAESEVVDVTVS